MGMGKMNVSINPFLNARKRMALIMLRDSIQKQTLTYNDTNTRYGQLLRYNNITFMFRHGVMIIGEPMSGKTKVKETSLILLQKRMCLCVFTKIYTKIS